MIKTGLVLSGGAARGVAHLGILEVIEEMGITIEAISGVSSGAIVGALYGNGIKPREILEIICKTKQLQLIRPALSKTGFFRIEVLEDILKKYLNHQTFESLNLKLYVAATRLKDGKTKYFQTGDLIRPVVASSCIPVLFKPYEIDEEFFVDGGIINNLPVEPLITNCDRIIGLLCNPIDSIYQVTNMKSLLERTLLMAINTNTYSRRSQCDLLLEPPELGRFKAMNLSKATEIYEIGYRYANSRKKDLEKLFNC